ncbi:MAG: N-acetyltransferase [Candidatus Wallbacteria bacterium HGW-Wallbacteria-1]|jgi:spermidine synthase|uniref:N-acetyltransferase n=1 Tax=Candidatus Wallbacteria bacterium HGW-Wallbacteria-1 TaxID=2013854 RepID=A0A2N1PKG0_9BACT|nr:MAG: N-acetyltransferase [Candidatus Wallbacteria bacterium HGW-Wallbacteria-1]
MNYGKADMDFQNRGAENLREVYTFHFLTPAGNGDRSLAIQLFSLYLSAGWVTPDDDSDLFWIDRVVAGSLLFAVAIHNDRVIGMGRAISDGNSDAYIQDVTVLPDHRGRGIGAAIVKMISARLVSQGIEWIGLVAAPGAELFYSKLGFRPLEGHVPMKLDIDFFK